MVHADHRVVLSLRGKPEEGVSTVRTTGKNAFGAGGLDRRRDMLSFFITEQTTFSGVGIKCQHGQAWIFDAELPLQARRSDAHGCQDTFCI